MYIRLVANSEIASIVAQGHLVPTPNEYPPYRPGEVVCLFDTEDINGIVTTFGEACVSTRISNKDDAGVVTLSVLILQGLNEANLEQDLSQTGWNNAFAYRGNIPIENIRIWGTVQFDARMEAMIQLLPNTLIQHPEPLEIGQP